MWRPRFYYAIGLALLASLLLGQQEQGPFPPTTEQRGAITKRAAELAGRIETLRGRGVDSRLLTDVEVYHKAAVWALRYDDEFYRSEYVQHALDSLNTGMARVGELEAGTHSWTNRTGRLVRAYRSRVDGSVQPYGLVIPPAYDGSRPWRLDVILHGRNARLTETSFIAAHDSDKEIPPDQDFLQLEVFGRTNNAYRWAGETDVFEALEAVQRDYRIDADRIVLRGFSMGGAGAWHLGLHHPDRWVVVEAGAGFTDTLNYARQSLEGAPLPVKYTWNIYDAVAYARNAFNVPIVGYGGEDDPQLQASVNIREALAGDGVVFQPEGLNFVTTDIRARFLVGPKTQHRWHPESQRLSNEFLSPIAQRGRQVPDRIRFVTHSERYPRCFWVTVDALRETGFEHRAEVDAARRVGRENAPGPADDEWEIEVTTKNVRRLILSDTGHVTRLTLDNQELALPSVTGGRPDELYLQRAPGSGAPQWKVNAEAAAIRESGLKKKPGLQGPIDDAFLDAFLCVRPTGKPWNEAAHAKIIEALETFAREYPKWLRADLPVKDDTDVTVADIASHNLILFGDPASNRLIAKIVAELPIDWTDKEIRLAGKTYSAGDHYAAVIYPNPLNPERYVVLNSGHTFHEPEFRGTNALLFPRLGDHAVISVKKSTAGDAESNVVDSGFFDRDWQVPRASP